MYPCARRLPVRCQYAHYDGFETAKELGRLYKNIKILAISMNGEEKSITGMFRNGPNGYMLKGDNPIELNKAIERVYYTGCYLSSEVGNVLFRYIQD